VERLPRGPLAALPRALQRRAVWRLLSDGTGRGPGRRLLSELLDDLAMARCTRRQVPGGWTLALRSSELLLVPPRARDAVAAPDRLRFPASAGATRPPARLPVPGEVRLDDGRVLCAEVVSAEPGSPVPRDPCIAELDADALTADLAVRFPRPGDRFRALGAPGSRPLRRFLADAGIPSAERGGVPIVLAGDEPIWAAGVRPADRPRVRPCTRRRLRLTLADRPHRPHRPDLA
jgi:tRNA(Ile)-lysidine synthetase-like protein